MKDSKMLPKKKPQSVFEEIESKRLHVLSKEELKSLVAKANTNSSTAESMRNLIAERLAAFIGAQRCDICRLPGYSPVGITTYPCICDNVENKLNKQHIETVYEAYRLCLTAK